MRLIIPWGSLMGLQFSVIFAKGRSKPGRLPRVPLGASSNVSEWYLESIADSEGDPGEIHQVWDETNRELHRKIQEDHPGAEAKSEGNENASDC